jgi:AAA domain, putative AbiEii toxin, Type IV TA system/AAA ATPase domain
MIRLVYSTFSINNFRTFQELQVELSPVCLISGRNNAGKSALLEAAFLHAAGPRAGISAIATLYGARGLGPISLNTGESGTIWDSLYHNYNINSPVRLEGVFSGEPVVVEIVEIEGAAARLGGQTTGESGQTFSQSINVRFRRASHPFRQYKQTATQQSIGQPIVGLINVQFGGINLQVNPASEPFLSAFYLSGRTRASQAELATRYSNLRVRGRGEDFLDAIRQIEPRLKSLEVLVVSGQPVLHADIGGPDLLPLSLFGEGMVAAADFISAIYQSKGGVVLIDEVENGIHYSVLEKVWWQIKRASQRTNTQVIATTHSRECLQAARSAFLKEPANLGLIRLWRDVKNANIVRATKYDARELDDALSLDLDVR